MLRFLCIIPNSSEASPKVVQEECSTRPARFRGFRSAAAHSQRYLLALPAPHAPFSQFGTRQSLEAGHRSPTDEKKLEISLTSLISNTSIFLIDNFLPISRTNFRASSCRSPLATRHSSLLSNRNTQKLKIALSHRKQSLAHFLIATFRALFHPAAESSSVRNPLASPYVLNPVLGGCNLPCRP